MDFLKEYEFWLSSDAIDTQTRDELMRIKGDEAEIKERFFDHLEFGTAGLRGIIGAGINRMNQYVVQRVTQGIADYITKCEGEHGKARGVAIAYDCRYFSDTFAEQAALVLAANGIKAYLFDALRPTPELSFAIRHLGAIAGINITASHNPANYNGYKVYWEDGGQLSPNASDKVSEFIGQTPLFTAKAISRRDAEKSRLLVSIGKEVDDAFSDAVYTQALNPGAVKRVADRFKLVYTPLHGAGSKPVQAILKKAGFTQVIVVKEQEMPDSAFSTVASPNPENREAFDLAIVLAKREDAPLIIGTDPDSDRLGVVARNARGEYVCLSGNQIGALLLHYILSVKSARNELTPRSAVISTIVSTKLTRAICAYYGVTYFETFTGFKFMAEKMLEFEKNETYECVFAFEESFGFLAGTHARDKDAVVASLLMAELAAYYFEQGKTLFDVLNDMYAQYGYFAEQTVSITLEGVEGIQKIARTMQELRSCKPDKIGNFAVLAIRDYHPGKRFDMQSGMETDMELSGSNVLYFELSDGVSFVARPSGTEPKLKLYYLAQGKTENDVRETLEAARNAVSETLGCG